MSTKKTKNPSRLKPSDPGRAEYVPERWFRRPGSLDYRAMPSLMAGEKGWFSHE
jgi:hypothetical protein